MRGVFGRSDLATVQNEIITQRRGEGKTLNSAPLREKNGLVMEEGAKTEPDGYKEIPVMTDESVERGRWFVAFFSFFPALI
jgi:hypothetical protein